MDDKRNHLAARDDSTGHALRPLCPCPDDHISNAIANVLMDVLIKGAS
jgi:hypothetical protein